MNKEKIEKEVQGIINNFVEKLKDIEIEVKGKDFYLIRRKNLRKEGEKDVYFETGKKFREQWFKTNKNNDGEYIIAEKASWKK